MDKTEYTVRIEKSGGFGYRKTIFHRNVSGWFIIKSIQKNYLFIIMMLSRKRFVLGGLIVR